MGFLLRAVELHFVESQSPGSVELLLAGQAFELKLLSMFPF